MQKGDIFEPATIFRNNISLKKYGHKAIHPIVYLGPYNRDYFLGLMVTHSGGYGNLDFSKPDYFDGEANDFANTYIVDALLIKPVDWLIGINPIGKLSEKGIQFLESIIVDKTPVEWSNYLTS